MASIFNSVLHEIKPSPFKLINLAQKVAVNVASWSFVAYAAEDQCSVELYLILIGNICFL